MALALYIGFRLFYDNLRGRVTREEIDNLVSRAEALGGDGVNDLSIVRQFLEDDDGREFVMVNLVRVPDAMVTHPDTGAQVPAREMMKACTNSFMPLLMRRGGHPALVARKVGGYLDSWMVGPDPGWSMVGFVRYRSRRDMLKVVLDPAFEAAHEYKRVALAETFSFPTQPFLRAYIGPRGSVFLILALAAALAQLAMLATG
ncbi:hypothetical protein AWC20_01355 [Mycobacterium parmense]|nr:hypothetical protein AWC20_01355 [Mycobacterium parmense]